MGAYDDGGMTRAIAAAKEAGIPVGESKTSLELATERVERATQALDKVLNNPKATSKQINSALDRLNSATDIQIKETLNSLNKPSVGTSGGGIPSGGTSGGGIPSGGGDTTPPPKPDIPLTPSLVTTPTVTTKPPVKTAPIDTVLIDTDEIGVDTMIDLIFEDIGGQELINVARNDTINGQTISYKPIKNLSSIQQQYNPNNILSLQNTSDKYFTNFPIKLETRLLEEGEGSGPNGSYVYIEDETGDLIIELAGLDVDEQLEVEISLSGTIYEAEFNES